MILSIRKWNATDDRVVVEMVCPGMVKTYPCSWLKEKKTVRTVPGVRIVTSNNGKSSWICQAVIFGDYGEQVLKMYRQRHLTGSNPLGNTRQYFREFSRLFDVWQAENGRAAVRKWEGDPEDIPAVLHEKYAGFYSHVGKKRGKILDGFVISVAKTGRLTELDIRLFPFITEYILKKN